MQIQTLKLWEGRDDVELTTFLNIPEPFADQTEKRPALIVCAGGAYMSCPRHGNEGDPVAMTFAADGYQTFVLEYSVGSKAPEGKALFPAQLYDFGKAFLTIREHAEEWHVDVNRISIMGFSAGAHLCATLATRWNDGRLADKFSVSSEYFKPLAAFLMYPVADYPLQEEFRKGLTIPSMTDGLKESNRAIFGVEDPDQEMLLDNSPAHHVTKDCPPVFLAAAQDDDLVSVGNTLSMAQSLQKAGVPYEVHIFEKGMHGFALGRHLLYPWRDDRAYPAGAWVPMAKTFLLRHNAPESGEYDEANFTEIFKDKI